MNQEENKTEISKETNRGVSIEAQIEAVLFYKNEPISIKKLATILDTKEEEIKEAIQNLEESLKDGNRGISIIMDEDEVSLVTSIETSGLIDKIAKDEMSKDIGKSGLETLAIILYNGPISRRDIDYIRGVNSTFILRNLTLRGLVEKVENPKDSRVSLYKATISTLAHLGLSKVDDLPQYESFKLATEASLKQEDINQKVEG